MLITGGGGTDYMHGGSGAVGCQALPCMVVADALVDEARSWDGWLCNHGFLGLV